MEAHPGISPGTIRFADGRVLLLPREPLPQLAIATSESFLDCSTGSPVSLAVYCGFLNGSGGRSCTGKAELMRLCGGCLSPHFEIGADSPSHTDIGDLQDRFSTLRVPALNW